MSIVSGSPPSAPASMGGLSSAVEDVSTGMSSLRFDGSATLVRRMEHNSNASKFTHSTWLKLTGKGQQGNDYINFFQACQNYPYWNEYAGMGFRENGSLFVFQFDNQGSKSGLNGNYSAAATPYFRDYTGWYHIVTSYNSNDGWVKQYVNGEEVASYSYSTASYCLLMNSSEGREI